MAQLVRTLPNTQEKSHTLSLMSFNILADRYSGSGTASNPYTLLVLSHQIQKQLKANKPSTDTF